MSAQIEEVLEMDRRTYIGGSDTAAILGVSPWKSKFALYQEKIGEWQQEIKPEKERIFARGKRWEPIVIEMLIDELEDRGHDVQVAGRNNRIKDSEHDFLAAEIDLELIVDGELINGEMKTVHPFASKDWGEQGTDEIPLYYTAQVLHGQMVTRRKKTVVAALIGADDLRVHFVDRDEEMIRIIRAREIEFWNNVQNRIAPDPVTDDDICRLYRHDCGEILEADQELLDLVAQASNTKSDLKAAETRLEVLQTQIKARMGEAALLMYNGQKLVTWKNNKDSSKTDWKEAFFEIVRHSIGLSKADIDSTIQKFTTTKPGSRPFLLK